MRENNYAHEDYNDTEYSQERLVDTQRLNVKGNQFKTIDVREGRQKSSSRAGMKADIQPTIVPPEKMRTLNYDEPVRNLLYK